MRDHANVSPQFWTGQTGKKLRSNPDAQRLAFYLITCPSSNMIGLYYLPLPTICHELGSPLEGASKGLKVLEEANFASYDHETETVFVHEMAKFQIGESLSPKDNRVKGIQTQLATYSKSPFYNEFLARYGEAFNLDLEPVDAVENGPETEAPSKPLRSQGQGQGQGQGQDNTPSECLSAGADDSDPDEEKQAVKEAKLEKSAELLEAEKRFIKRWNDTPGVCAILGDKLSQKRRTAFRARKSEHGWSERAAEALGKFPLMCGFKPDAEWFLKPDSVNKILEGKYDWSKESDKSPKPQPQNNQRATF